MSMNKYIHPQNIYKYPTDFTQLAIEYPEFRSCVTLDINGKVKVDFKNENFLRSLTRCLLKKDFDLDVYLPPFKLIPTLPLRLNYILWLKDLMTELGSSDVLGIDIGCGASCIYPLLAAKRNKWKMIAFETNAESSAHATENVTNNNLTDFIQVIHQEDKNKIFSKLLEIPEVKVVDFAMCNPPFYSSFDELDFNKNNRTGNRPLPNNFISGCADEVIVSGGECEFIYKIIKESCQLKDTIKIYTTMCGHKNSVKAILGVLAKEGIVNVATTEFCQGNTTRWGIAWSFLPNIRLESMPRCAANTVKSKTFSFTLLEKTSVTKAFKKLQDIFERINIKLELTQQINDMMIYSEVNALTNTWSKQRRKRRLLQRKELPQIENHINSEAETKSQESGKRHREENLSNINVKRFKSIESEPTTDLNNSFLVFGLTVGKVKETVRLDLNYIKGEGKLNGVYQVLQYIINSWK